jgi:RHS repeat-associated protein
VRLRVLAAGTSAWLALLAPHFARATDVGRIPASYHVDPDGGFDYTIPIWLPPGPNGVTPQLALVYDSSSSTGTNSVNATSPMPLAGTSSMDAVPAGAGWVLSGLSLIQRTDFTVADNGGAGVYGYVPADPYALDGNLLRLTSSGDYGQAGSTYQTEIADFSQVTAHGSTVSGPEYWTAQLKNGLTYEYGNTASSQIASPNGVSGDIREWLLDKVSDVYGNSYTISYGPGASGSSGIAVPTTISWTPQSQGGSSYNYTVTFSYVGRGSQEAITAYDTNGYQLENNNLLSAITVAYKGTTVRYYKLNYSPSSLTGRSLLTSIQECADSTLSECFPSTSLAYGSGQSGVSSSGQTAVSGATQIVGAYDFTGDGLSDILYLQGSTLYAALSNGAGFNAGVSTGITPSSWVIGDVLGNDKDEIMTGQSGVWWLYTWNGSGFTGQSLGIPYCITCQYELADVNGDGLPDLVQLQGSNGSIAIAVALNTSSGGTPSFGGMSGWTANIPIPQYATGQVLGAWFVTPQAYFQSFDGVKLEGGSLDDLMLGWQTEMEMGGGTQYLTVLEELVPANGSFNVQQVNDFTSSANAPPQQMFYGDFNGDHCSDFTFATAPGQPTGAYESACDGNGEQISSDVGTVVGVADWDGRNRGDLLVNQGGYLGVETSTGSGFSPVSTTTIPLTSGETALPLSVTGGGLADIGIINGGTLTYYLHNVANDPPDTLTTVTDGNGNVIKINYASTLGVGNVYTPYSSSESGVTAPAYPEAPYADNLFVVQTLTLPDGMGGSYTKSYRYTDLREDLSRGSSLEGFESVQITDSRNSQVETISYDLPFPFGGMVNEDDVAQSGGTHVSTVAYVNKDDELNSTPTEFRHFPYASSVTTTEYEVGGAENGVEVSQAVTEYQNPDNYGNFAKIDTTLTGGAASQYDGSSWTTDTTASYVDDSSTWCLTLPSSISVAKTAPDQAAITHTSTYTRDGSYCRPSQVVKDAGNSSYDVTRAFKYDGFGNVNKVTVTGAGISTARVWNYTWGTTGQFQTVIQDPVASASGYEEAIAYDYGLGLKSSDVIQTTGGTEDAPPTTWGYYGLGQPKSEGFPDGTSLDWTYTACGQASCNDYPNAFEAVIATAEQSGGGTISTQSAYLDSLGRTVAATKTLMDGTQALTEQGYDQFGNVVKQSSPCNGSNCPQYWTQVKYDALNRPVTILSPDPQDPSVQDTTQISYAGGKTTTTNAQNEVSTQVTDPSGALRETIDGTGYAQNFTLDSDGDVLNVTDSGGTLIYSATYYHGGEGDYLATRNDRALGSWSYFPDAVGDVLSYEDAKGQQFAMQYDGLGRPVWRRDFTNTASGITCADPGVSSITCETNTLWTWGVTPSSHDVGKLDETQTTTTDGTYAEQNTYDADSRLSARAITIPGDATYTYGYGYNAQGSLGTLQYPAGGSYSGPKLSYAYSNGILSSVTDANSGTVYWHANAVDALGQVSEDTLGNGTVTERSFLPTSGLLTRITSGPTAGSATLQNQSYAYYPLGTLEQRQDNNSGLTENFTYDADNRLENSTLSNGNITTTNLEISSYNPDGSMKEKTETGGTDAPVAYTPAWTSYNYPKSISATLPSGGNESATFDYGPDRQRWRMVYTEGSASETTEYIGGSMEKVSSTVGTDYRYYIYGADGLAAVQNVSGTTPTTDYVLSDQEGSISSLLTSTGGAVVNESFTAYGNRREASTWSGPPSSTEEGTMDGITRQGFTGQTVLGQMGLNHMNGRVEDAVTGTFLSPDPYVNDPTNAQDYYRYAYVYNSPLSNVDPSGFETDVPDLPGVTVSAPRLPGWVVLENMDTWGSCPAGCVAYFNSFGDGGRGGASGPAPTRQQSQRTNTPQCSAARAQAAALANEFSSLGRGITWSGIGLVSASGIAALFAPEGAPAEYVGAAEGAGLIEAGNALSAIGTGLQGLAQTGTVGGGLRAAFTAVGIDQAIGQVPRLFGGLTDATRTAAAALLSQTADALRNEEAACGH